MRLRRISNQPASRTGSAASRSACQGDAAYAGKPSEGKAIICIYRPGGAVGSAAHDHLYVNGVYLATLLNGEYAWTEVGPGTVVVAGMAKMYYGPSIIMSSAAAVNQTRGQAERIRVEAEAGKIYYMKWSSGMFATDIKVKLMDPGVGAKEMRKLHPSKPANTGEDKSEQQGDADEIGSDASGRRKRREQLNYLPGLAGALAGAGVRIPSTECEPVERIKRTTRQMDVHMNMTAPTWLAE